MVAKKIDETVCEKPEPGFYHAVFVDSWKIFARPANATGLVFIMAAVCFKFFVSHTDYSCTIGAFRILLPVGFIVSVVAWGCLFWYYMEMICLTAFDEDELPDVEMGSIFGFVWNIIKSIYMFVCTIAASLLPTVIIANILEAIGISQPLLLNIIALSGLFFFPMIVLIISVVQQLWLIFRPDYIAIPIAKAFAPYMVTAALVFAGATLQLSTIEYGGLQQSSTFTVALHLTANILTQALILIAMRTIGLFHRHYNCYMRW